MNNSQKLENFAKIKLAKALAPLVCKHKIVGVGTGSTSELAIIEIANLMHTSNLQMRFVATSLACEWKCKELGLNVVEATSVDEIDFGFDGADAVDKNCRAIKGKGGAMLREKLVAVRCKEYVLIADDSKFVENIASRSEVPVEVFPEMLKYVENKLIELGAKNIVLRPALKTFGPAYTCSGNIILDCSFVQIDDALEGQIKSITGVVESGLFLSQASKVILASEVENEEVRVFKRA